MTLAMAGLHGSASSERPVERAVELAGSVRASEAHDKQNRRHYLGLATEVAHVRLCANPTI
jgi:hypothetical protein